MGQQFNTVDTPALTLMNIAGAFAVVTDAQGKAIASVVTALEQSYLSGAASNIQQQINAIATGLHLKGAWDASKGTYPTPDEVGDYWICSVPGVVETVQYNQGDGLYCTAMPDTFARIPNVQDVISVNGKQGVVTLTAADVGAATQADIDASLLPYTIKTAVNGKNTTVTIKDGVLTVDASTSGASKKTVTFTDGDLTAGIYTFVHALGMKADLAVTVSDGSFAVCSPDIVFVDDQSLTLDFSNLQPLVGTYTVCAMG